MKQRDYLSIVIGGGVLMLVGVVIGFTLFISLQAKQMITQINVDLANISNALIQNNQITSQSQATLNGVVKFLNEKEAMPEPKNPFLEEDNN